MHHAIRPAAPLAAMTASVLLAAAALAQAGSPAHAESAAIPGVPLPVPASDVTTTDTDLQATDREVVVAVEGAEGLEVHKLRTRSVSAAQALASSLDTQEGIVAEANSAYSVPGIGDPLPAGAKDGAAVKAASSTGRVAWSHALDGEQHGSSQWGLRSVNAAGAWEVTRGGGVTVAVVDSGVDAGHPDLAGRVRSQVDLVADGRGGDPNGHGTHVAGIVAASLDGAGVAGLANEVSIVSVRVLDASGSGDTATIARGILQAVDTGARVVNLSLGGGYSQVVHSAVQYALDRGVTVVAAGGNQYQEGNPTTYPAAHAGVIGVSAMGPEGHSSWFANTGSYIDIAAPGEDVLSTVPGGRWGYADGTSMAAPFVSAAAALVRAANPTLSRAGVDSVLLATARDDSSGNGRDHLFGEGLLQADRAAAEAAGAAGGLHGPAARVSVWPVSGASKLRVDVDPDRGRGYWSFRVQRKAADGSWRDLRAYRTAGARERRTLNLRGGSYRVVVKAQHGHRGVTSAEVYLRR